MPEGRPGLPYLGWGGAAPAPGLAFGALLAMTAVWGSTFFMIKDVVTRIGVADMLTVRFALASVVDRSPGSSPVGRLRMSRQTLLRGAPARPALRRRPDPADRRPRSTPASVSGFITGLYVVITPLLGALILRVRIAPTTWIAVGLATLGLGVLSLNGFAVGYGELLTLASAVVYAGHIIAMGRLSDPGTALSLTVVQMVVITLVCGIAAAPDGRQLPARRRLADRGLPRLVAGALTMFLQTWAQARVEATRAAVIMAMEPVWAAAFAVALGGEKVTVRMVIGGLAILSAMYLVELAPRPVPGSAPGPVAADDRPPVRAPAG